MDTQNFRFKRGQEQTTRITRAEENEYEKPKTPQSNYLQNIETNTQNHSTRVYQRAKQLNQNQVKS